MSREQYVQKMTPYANRVSAAIGVPVGVILSHWILETGNGTSRLAKSDVNNHAGIKHNSKGADFKSGEYAGYNSIDSFVNDYIRLINNLSYYKGFRNQSDPYKAIQELHKSPWAEDPEQDKKLVQIFNSLSGQSLPTGVTLPSVSLDGLSDGEVKNMAMIGVGVVALVALLGK